MSRDDELSVLGAGDGPTPMPTRADAADAALRSLHEQLRQLVEQWRASTYKKAIQIPAADAIQQCADSLARLIEAHRPAPTRDWYRDQ